MSPPLKGVKRQFLQIGSVLLACYDLCTSPPTQEREMNLVEQYVISAERIPNMPNELK